MSTEAGKRAGDATGEETPKRSKRSLLLVGGLVGMIGLAYVTSLMAVPQRREHRVFDGPFIAPLAEQISINLADQGGKRFLVAEFNAEFEAYEEAYAVARLQSPLYRAAIKDALLDIGSSQTSAEVTNVALADAFLEEVRVVADPLLFPIHVGDARRPTDADSESGLRPGRSTSDSSMRGPLYDHTLFVDAPRGTIRLDDGPPTSFEGVETDLVVRDAVGRALHLDVTRLDPEFVGEVPVGTLGRVRRIYKEKLLVQ